MYRTPHIPSGYRVDYGGKLMPPSDYLIERPLTEEDGSPITIGAFTATEWVINPKYLIKI